MNRVRTGGLPWPNLDQLPNPRDRKPDLVADDAVDLPAKDFVDLASRLGV